MALHPSHRRLSAYTRAQDICHFGFKNIRYVDMQSNRAKRRSRSTACALEKGSTLSPRILYCDTYLVARRRRLISISQRVCTLVSSSRTSSCVTCFTSSRTSTSQSINRLRTRSLHGRLCTIRFASDSRREASSTIIVL